jgi:carbonic anhydrase
VTASRSLARVKQTGSEGQKPFATILTCADSRTAPELFFDQGLGDLFVVRVAGNVTDTMGLASIEYSVDHLGVPLIVVVGHTRCGAVDAAVKTVDSPTVAREPHHDQSHFDGNLTALVNAIIPAVEDAKRTGVVPLLNASIRQNVLQSMRELSSRSVELEREISSGDVKVMGAIYDVDKGTIEWIAPPAP